MAAEADLRADAELAERRASKGSAIDFFSLDSFEAACRECGWDQNRKIEMLARLAKDDNDPRNQLAAIRYLDEVAEKVLTMSGGVRETTITSVSGEVVTQDKFTESLLSGAVRTEEVILESTEIEQEEDEPEAVEAEIDTEDISDDGDEESDKPDDNPADKENQRWGQRPPTKFTDGYTGLSGTPDGEAG